MSNERDKVFRVTAAPGPTGKCVAEFVDFILNEHREPGLRAGLDDAVRSEVAKLIRFGNNADARGNDLPDE